MYKGLAAFGLALAVLISPSFALAATVAGGESYALPSEGEVAGNLYVGAGEITASGSMREDATLAGGTIIIPGTVGGDLLVGGGDIDVLGNVAGDVRVAGGDVLIAGSVQGDVLVLAGNVKILETATVGGDVLVMGGDVSLDGSIAGTARLYAGKVTLRGETGDLFVKSRDITLSGAKIRGDFTYTSANAAKIDSLTSIEGETNRTQIAAPSRSELAEVAAFLGGLFFLAKFVALLAATLLAFYLFRSFSVRYGTNAVAGFGWNVLLGIAALILIPIIAIILLVTIVGAYVGIGALIGYVLLLLVAKIFSGIVAGAVLSRVFVREVRVTLPWVLGGVIFMEFVFLAPFVGWAISLIIYLMSLGALIRFLHGGWQRRESLGDEA